MYEDLVDYTCNLSDIIVLDNINLYFLLVSPVKALLLTAYSATITIMVTHHRQNHIFSHVFHFARLLPENCQIP